MIKGASVKTVLRVTGRVRTVHVLGETGGNTGALLTAYGQGDSVVISTTAAVSASGDNLILGGQTGE